MNTVKWTILFLAALVSNARCQELDSVQNSIWVNNNVPPFYSTYQPTYWTPDGLFWYYYYSTTPFYNQYPPRPLYWNPVVQQNEGLRYPPPEGLQTNPTYPPPEGLQTNPTYPPPEGRQTSPTYPPPNTGTTQSTEFANEGEFEQEQTTTDVNLDPFQSEVDWSFLEDDEFDWLNTVDFGEEDWTGFDVKSFEERSPTSVITGFVATKPNTAIARTTTGQRGAVSSVSAFAGKR